MPSPSTTHSEAAKLSQEAYKAAKANLDTITYNMSQKTAALFYEAVNEARVNVNIKGEKAMAEAVQKLAMQGIYASSHTDKNGRGYRVPADVAVRQAVYTSGRQRFNGQVLAVAQRTGQDLIEVNGTPNCRPSHEAINGQVFSISGLDPRYKKWTPDLEALTHDYNCGHRIAIYHESLGSVFRDPLEGTGYTLEEARKAFSKQRAYENQIRKQKRVVEALNAAGLDASEVNAKLNATRHRLRQHIEANSKILHRERHREQLYDSAARMKTAVVRIEKQNIAELEQAVIDYGNKIKAIDKKMEALEANDYMGVWRYGVTVMDFEGKAAAIPAKYKYYKEELAKLDPSSPEYAKLAANYETAKKYKRDGNRYLKLKAERSQLENERIMARKSIDEKRAKLAAMVPGGKKSAVETRYEYAYTDTRKKSAKNFKSSADADKYLRPKSGVVWQEIDLDTKHALYDYTSGSGGFNRPLSGFRKPWSDAGSGWEEKYYVGRQGVHLDYEGKGDSIVKMTEAIAKSSYPDDMWLYRGCDPNAIESLLGIDYGSLGKYTQEELDALFTDKEGRIDSFVSCGSKRGTGFSSKSVIMKIYVPEGSQAIYAEPWSCFGQGDKLKWDGVKDQSSYGSELETIIQRGGAYRVKKIEKKGSKYHIELEHRPERGYDTFGQDKSKWDKLDEDFKGKK